jgi:hypothetical protein
MVGCHRGDRSERHPVVSTPGRQAWQSAGVGTGFGGVGVFGM